MPDPNLHLRAGCQEGGRGEVNLPPGGRRFGKAGIGLWKIGGRRRKRRKGGRIYTLDRRVGGFR